MGVDSADGQRETRVPDCARQDGGHRAGDHRVRQGESGRGLEGLAEDGAGGGRRGQRQGKRERKKRKRESFFSPNLCSTLVSTF